MQVPVQGRGLLEDPRERKGDEVQPAQADISVLHESATSTRRSTRGDLDLIGNVERSMEVQLSEWGKEQAAEVASAREAATFVLAAGT